MIDSEAAFSRSVGAINKVSIPATLQSNDTRFFLIFSYTLCQSHEWLNNTLTGPCPMPEIVNGKASKI
jgi:hypothetical protein